MTPRIFVRILRSRGRIDSRFHVGRLRMRGMTRTSPNPPVRFASPKAVRYHVAETVGVWDSSGEQGRSELGEIYRRAGQ